MKVEGTRKKQNKKSKIFSLSSWFVKPISESRTSQPFCNFWTTLSGKFSLIFIIKTGRLKRSQFMILFFSSKTLRKFFIFLIYILIDYLVHEISKEFWKHSHFENMRAGFLLRCQNWLRWKKNIICLWNIESLKQKLAFGYVIVPNIGQNII